MHGHGYTPPTPRQPSTGALVVLRVFIVAVALLSIGFLAWIAPLVAAIVTRKARDWMALVGSFVLLGVSVGLISTDKTDDLSTPAGNAGMIILLLNACASAGHYLYADIRHYQQPRFAGYLSPQHPTIPTTAYGYPPAPAPQPYAPASPVPQPPVQQQPQPQPEPQRPGPARIDQVRAELDELSDYLRKHEGDR